MKRRAIVSVITVCMMLFTLSPVISSAASLKTFTHGKYTEPMGIEDEYIGEVKQILMEFLDDTYASSIDARGKYCTEVWNDIQSTYKEGRTIIDQLTVDQLMDDDVEFPDCFGILDALGDLTWVKSSKDLQAVKNRYIKEINNEYKEFKASNYNDYYWDLIQDGKYMGLKQINNAKLFKDAAAGYLLAMDAMESACDKEEIKEYKDDAITRIKQYVNLGLEPKHYTSAQWKKITSIRDQAIRNIQAAQLEEQIEEIYTKAGEDLYAITEIKFPLEGETIVDELSSKLEDYVDSLNDENYSEAALERIYEIWSNADDALMYAETRAQAQKIYDTAIAKIKAVPTIQQEIAAIKKATPKITSVKSINSNSLKVSWKKVSGVSGYAVYRATTPKGKYSKIKTVKGTSLKDTGLKLGKTYYYKIRAYKTLNNSSYYSNASKAVKGVPMLAKTSLTLSKSGKSVTLKWKKVSDAKGYQIYRATSYNGKYRLVKTVKSGNTMKWKDTKVKKGGKYYYKIRSYCKIKGKTKYSPYSSIKRIVR